MKAFKWLNILKQEGIEHLECGEIEEGLACLTLYCLLILFTATIITTLVIGFIKEFISG
jgi:hypothetical protein